MSPFSAPFFWGTQKRGLLLPKRAAALWEGTRWCTLADPTSPFGRLCRVPAFLHCGCWLMLQKNPETESVRN
jgi:hypothetical protein